MKIVGMCFVFLFVSMISIGQTVDEFDFKNGSFQLKPLFDSSGKLIQLRAIFNKEDITDKLNMTIILCVPKSVDQFETSLATLMRNGILTDYDREYIKSQETSYFLVEVKLSTKKYRQVYAYQEIKLYIDDLIKLP